MYLDVILDDSRVLIDIDRIAEVEWKQWHLRYLQISFLHLSAVQCFVDIPPQTRQLSGTNKLSQTTGTGDAFEAGSSKHHQNF